MKREALTGSSAVDNFDSVAVEDREEIDENLNQVNVSELQVDSSEIPSCVQSHSSKTLNMDPTILKTTNMDPTTLKITMSVNTDTSATNSLEPTRSHPNLKDTQPNSIEKELASSTTEPLGELLEELKKNIQNLSSKVDKSYSKCLGIKNLLNKNSPR